MSTLSNRPIGFQSRACNGCNAALFVAATVPVAGVVLCQRCERSDASARIAGLLADVQSLCEGSGVFAGMTPAERSEQLAAMGLPGIDAEPKFKGFAKLSDDRLIRIISGEDLFTMPGESAGQAVGEALTELCNRLAQPTPAERDKIESICEQMDLAEQQPERWDGMA